MGPVAIIGAGPGGIAAAQWLKSVGYEPHIFEAHSGPGGQWDHANPMSGVWPAMVTNTFLEATRFSDEEYPDGTALFPHNREVLDYFTRYAESRGLLEHARFGCMLERIERTANGYQLSFLEDGSQFVENYFRVVIATGRFNKPLIPKMKGADSFLGDMGIIHTFDYKNPEDYRGKHVLVAGGSISALEIASDLSMLGAASVRLTQRRQRYVNPKMVLGVPLEYYAFTYDRAVLVLGDDKEALLKEDEALVHRYAGDPSRYGTPKPNEDFSKAGVTGSQHYLNLVAEGRVKPVPWIADINGRQAIFENGESAEVDGIIAGTGFALNLPFLSADIEAIVQNSETSIMLDEYTFHPDLPGLAFMGLWSQLGSYPTPLEQQARFLAYTWSGVLPERTEADMRAGLAACEGQGHHVGYRRQNEMALRFARLCGTDPANIVDTDILQTVHRSATTGLMYRLVGPDAMPNAALRLSNQVDRFGPKEGEER